ncbi:MAG: glyoxalase family protein [Oceanospirillaceae bacterium]|nr:glyoxalase family protein [Oceanospirillaceae bacterium]
MNTPTINYLEFPCQDMEATRTFFGTVFGWEFTDYGPDYMSFSGQQAGVDGGFFRSEHSSSTTNGAALVVFFSENLEATMEKIVACGGIIVQPMFDFPGGRRFHFSEPSGNEFAVWGAAENTDG